MTNEFKLLWAKFSPTAIVPTKDFHNAGFDIYEDVIRSTGKEFYVLKPNETKRFDTNIGYHIPDGYVAIVKQRSSHGKLPIFVGSGVCDSSYRNQVGVYMTNTSDSEVTIDLTKAIAQILFIKVEHCGQGSYIETTPEKFAEMFKSERGLGREGSSGK